MFGNDLRVPELTPRLTSRRVGIADVAHVEAVTRVLRATDYRYGGGACRDAVIALLSFGGRLLGGAATERVRSRLAVAVGDLHNLAGWTCFDTGRLDAARRHFERALALARLGGNDSLAANVWYRMGRVHLHHDAAEAALAAFGHGQVAARASGCPRTASLFSANQAWAHAKLGDATQAVRLLGRARDQFTRGGAGVPAPWVRFFDENDLSAMIGTVHTELAQTVDRAHTRVAIPVLAEVIAGYGDDMARSRSFNLISLAINHVLDGDVDQARAVGVQAVELATTLDSARPADRMRPLMREADRRRGNPDARHLSHLIASVLPAAS